MTTTQGYLSRPPAKATDRRPIPPSCRGGRTHRTRHRLPDPIRPQEVPPQPAPLNDPGRPTSRVSVYSADHREWTDHCHSDLLGVTICGEVAQSLPTQS